MVLYKTHQDEVNTMLNGDRQTHNVSVIIASAITAYARIHMCKIKLHILNNNGNIYYTDTDSIVTDIKLSEEFVDSK
jgi:hypothetical protein